MNSDIEQLREHYAAAPYASHAYFLASPEHVAATAMLLGATPAPPETARVLEIGCSSGGNIIPFAVRNPLAKAVGIDLSGCHILRGRALVDALELDNMFLHEADIATVTREEYGEYDYIICHGVYSWIPDASRAEVWRLCDSLLARGGIAYMSYNTYPGWKAKELVRDAMLFHARDHEAARDKIAYARSMVGFLRHVAPVDSLLRKIVDENIYILNRTSEDYLAHDYLEPFNRPFYFREFIEAASAASMRYLGESDLSRMFSENYGGQVSGPLSGHASNSLMFEQYLDFATNRSFRQSLLIRDVDAEGTGYRRGDRGRLRRLHVAAQLPCRNGQLRLDQSHQEFGVEGRATLSARHPLIKVAAEEIDRRWPGTVTHAELVEVVSARIGGQEAPVTIEMAMDELFEFLVARGIARYRLAPVALSVSGNRPEIDSVVRKLIGAGGGSDGVVAGRWHEGIDIDALDRRLYLHMDGTSDLAELQRVFAHLRQELEDNGDRGFEQRLSDAARWGLRVA